MNESDGLEAMTQGIVQRYRDAGEDPPIVIYVDRDCNDSGDSAEVQGCW